MLKSGAVKAAALFQRAHVTNKIDGGEIAGGVIEEHIFRARVRCADVSRARASVPIIDGVVILQTRVGTTPCRIANLAPQLPRLDAFVDASVGAPDQIPIAVLFHGFEEGIGHPHRVIGVLPRDGAIGFRVPVGVIDAELALFMTAAQDLDGAQYQCLRDLALPRLSNRFAQGRVLRRIKGGFRAARIDVGIGGVVSACLDNVFQPPTDEPRAGHHGGDFLFFDDFPIDELLHIRMVDIHHDHFGGAARHASGFDGTGGAVAHAQETHQPRGFPPARERLAIATQIGEIRPRTRAIFEQTRLAHP